MVFRINRQHLTRKEKEPAEAGSLDVQARTNTRSHPRPAAQDRLEPWFSAMWSGELVEHTLERLTVAVAVVEDANGFEPPENCRLTLHSPRRTVPVRIKTRAGSPSPAQCENVNAYQLA